MTEYEKMLSGQLYDACDAELLKDLNAVKVLCQQYNNLLPTDFAARNTLLRSILGQADKDTFINQPFYCDYGKHIHVGKRFFANFGLTILDEAPVRFGDDCFVGPNVNIYTACHSTNPEERNTRWEWALPVTIGNNVWLGGNVTILPGVTIGDNCTIGAGSVVTHDIPANTVAAGNPARVIRHLEKEIPGAPTMPTDNNEPTVQPTTPPTLKTDARVRRLVLVVGKNVLPRRQIVADLGLKQNSRCVFANNYMRPAYEQGYIDFAFPSSPSKPEQAYRLTAKGLELYEQLTQAHR